MNKFVFNGNIFSYPTVGLQYTCNLTFTAHELHNTLHMFQSIFIR